MMWILEEKGCLKKGIDECLSDYFECYLAMLYRQSPETYMTMVKCLVEVGLKPASGKKAIIDVNLSSSSSSSSTASGTASVSSEISQSANPTSPPSLSKTKRRIDLHHLTTKAFTNFFTLNCSGKNLSPLTILMHAERFSTRFYLLPQHRCSRPYIPPSQEWSNMSSMRNRIKDRMRIWTNSLGNSHCG